MLDKSLSLHPHACILHVCLHGRKLHAHVCLLLLLSLLLPLLVLLLPLLLPSLLVLLLLMELPALAAQSLLLGRDAGETSTLG